MTPYLLASVDRLVCRSVLLSSREMAFCLFPIAFPPTN
nr:MAG TPA: hypothetical protein [Caudoviricetes sp.]